MSWTVCVRACLRAGQPFDSHLLHVPTLDVHGHAKTHQVGRGRSGGTLPHMRARFVSSPAYRTPFVPDQGREAAHRPHPHAPPAVLPPFRAFAERGIGRSHNAVDNPAACDSLPSQGVAVLAVCTSSPTQTDPEGGERPLLTHPSVALQPATPRAAATGPNQTMAGLAAGSPPPDSAGTAQVDERGIIGPWRRTSFRVCCQLARRDCSRSRTCLRCREPARRWQPVASDYGPTPQAADISISGS